MVKNTRIRLWTTVVGVFVLLLLFSVILQWVNQQSKPQFNSKLSDITWRDQKPPLLLFEDFDTAMSILLRANGAIVKQGNFTTNTGMKDQENLFVANKVNEYTASLEAVVSDKLVNIPLPKEAVLVNFMEVSPDDKYLFVALEQVPSKKEIQNTSVSWFVYSLQDEKWSPDIVPKLPNKCLETTAEGIPILSKAAGWNLEDEKSSLSIICFENRDTQFSGNYPLYDIPPELITNSKKSLSLDFDPLSQRITIAPEEQGQDEQVPPEFLSSQDDETIPTEIQKLDAVDDFLMSLYSIPYSFLFGVMDVTTRSSGFAGMATTLESEESQTSVSFETSAFGQQLVSLHDGKTNQDKVLLQWFGRGPLNFMVVPLGTTGKILITIDSEIGVFDTETKQFAKLLDIPNFSNLSNEELQQNSSSHYQLSIL